MDKYDYVVPIQLTTAKNYHHFNYTCFSNIPSPNYCYFIDL